MHAAVAEMRTLVPWLSAMHLFSDAGAAFANADLLVSLRHALA
jgi:hypothetical protein